MQYSNWLLKMSGNQSFRVKTIFCLINHRQGWSHLATIFCRARMHKNEKEKPQERKPKDATARWEKQRLPQTEKRCITLIVSFNISLTRCAGLPSAPSNPRPRAPLPRELFDSPVRGAAGGGPLMSCSGHREMHHNLPARAARARLPYLLFNLAALIHTIKTLSH